MSGGLMLKFIHKVTSKFTRGSAGRANYAAGAFWLFADKGIKFLAELLVGFYLARYLGAEQFGLLNFTISYVILFQGISTLGLNEILMRELMYDRQQQVHIMSTALLMRVIASVVFIALILIFSVSLDASARILVAIISTSLMFRAFEIFTPYFQSIVRGEWVAFAQIAVTIIGSLMKILGVFYEVDLIWFAWIYSAEWLILGIGLFCIYIWNEKWSWTLKQIWAAKLLKSSWYLMLSAAAVNLYMRLDQVMIRQMIDNAANGHYAAAVRLSEIWYIFPSILCAIFFPAILNAKRRGDDHYRRRLKLLNAFLFWFSLIIALAVAPFSELLVILLYGKDYFPAAEILSYHIWSSVFVFFGVSSGYWLIAENLERVSLYRTLAGLVVNVLLNFLLIPELGAVGAAIATLFGQVTAAVIWMLFLPATRPIIVIQLESIFFPFKYVLAYLNKEKLNSH